MGKQKEINTKIKMEELSGGQKGGAYKRNPLKSTSLPLHPPCMCSRGRHPCEEHPSGNVYFTTRHRDQMAQRGDFISGCK